MHGIGCSGCKHASMQQPSLAGLLNQTRACFWWTGAHRRPAGLLQVRQRIAVIAVHWDSYSTARHPPLRCDASSSCTFNQAPSGLGRPYARHCLAAGDAQAACKMPAVQCAPCSSGGGCPARRRPEPAAEAPRRAGRGPAPCCRVPDARGGQAASGRPRRGRRRAQALGRHRARQPVRRHRRADGPGALLVMQGRPEVCRRWPQGAQEACCDGGALARRCGAPPPCAAAPLTACVRALLHGGLMSAAASTGQASAAPAASALLDAASLPGRVGRR
jgi:hypothetical protein